MGSNTRLHIELVGKDCQKPQTSIQGWRRCSPPAKRAGDIERRIRPRVAGESEPSRRSGHVVTFAGFYGDLTNQRDLTNPVTPERDVPVRLFLVGSVPRMSNHFLNPHVAEQAICA